MLLRARLDECLRPPSCADLGRRGQPSASASTGSTRHPETPEVAHDVGGGLIVALLSRHVVEWIGVGELQPCLD